MLLDLIQKIDRSIKEGKSKFNLCERIDRGYFDNENQHPVGFITQHDSNYAILIIRDYWHKNESGVQSGGIIWRLSFWEMKDGKLYKRLVREIGKSSSWPNLSKEEKEDCDQVSDIIEEWQNKALEENEEKLKDWISYL